MKGQHQDIGPLRASFQAGPPVQSLQASGAVQMLRRSQRGGRSQVLCYQRHAHRCQAHIKARHLPLASPRHRHGPRRVPGQEGGHHGAGGQHGGPAPLVVQHQGGVAQAQEERRLTGVTGAGDGLGRQRDVGDRQAVQPLSCALVDAGVGPGTLSGCLGPDRQLYGLQLVGLEQAEAAVQRVALCPERAKDLDRKRERF